MKKLIFLLALIFNLAFAICNCSSQWVYQSLPEYHDVSDIKFFDANTGLLVYNPNSGAGMLRTTNGGQNWTLINGWLYFGFLEKVDSTALYVPAICNSSIRIQRTFDRGLTWDSVSYTGLTNTYTGLSFINRDTGWISGTNYLSYHCIWKTNDGGNTLIQLTDTTGWGNIFFLKHKVNGEYIGWHFSLNGDNKFWKTTNSGLNWFQATRPTAQYPGYFEFYDENTGWFTWNTGISGGIYLSTNGGINWSNQNFPSGNGITNQFYEFKIINDDTLYGTGGYRTIAGGILRGLIWKTTNGGTNWGYQDIDTSMHIGPLGVLDFINSQTGWAYGGDGIHTTNGGGPITFTAINNNAQIIAKDYILFQNYPNPFNSISKIKYQISKSANVKIAIFDISGREISVSVNQRQSPGTYEYNYDAGKLSSGIYFYTLFANGKRIDTKKMMMIK